MGYSAWAIMHPYSTPSSFRPTDALARGSSTVSPQHAVPAQLIHQSILLQPQNHTRPHPNTNGLPSLDALALIQRFNNLEISAFLAEIRSSLPSDQLFCAGHLSQQQYHALSFLQCLPDQLIFQWLDWARSRGTSIVSKDLCSNSGSGTQGLAQSGASNPSQAQYDNSPSSVSLLDGLPSIPTDPTICDTPISQCSSSSRVGIPGYRSNHGASPLATASSQHLHWCFICHNPKPIETCEGFKRHVRETHEKRYYCMPQGPVLNTENGSKCAFCGILDPDPGHQSTHNIQHCVEQPLPQRSFSRKHLLTNHLLKYHGLVDGSVLAAQWHNNISKKHFACGFCGSFSKSLTKLANHVDTAHYGNNELIAAWDSNKVIRSLLSQPGVSELWQKWLATNSCLQESSLGWEPTIAKTLQERLEWGNEHAEILLTAAISQSNYGTSRQCFPGVQTNTSQSMQTQPNRLACLPFPSNSSHGSDNPAPTPDIRTFDLCPQQLAGYQTFENDPVLTGAYSSRPIPENTPQSYAPSMTTYSQHRGPPTQSQSPPNSGESVMDLRSSSYAPSNIQSLESQPRPAWSPEFLGLSQGISPDLITGTYSRQGPEPPITPSQVLVASTDSPLASPFGRRLLSSNHPKSPLGQINGPFVNADRQMHVAGSQSQQPKYYHGADRDDGSNSDMQSIVQRNSSRRHRGKHR